MSKYFVCGDCGEEVLEDAKACPNCGAIFDDEDINEKETDEEEIDEEEIDEEEIDEEEIDEEEIDEEEIDEEEIDEEEKEADYDRRINGTVAVIKASATLFVTIMILYIVISLIVLLSVVSGPIEDEFLIFILLFIGIGFTITYFSYYFIIWKANILEVLYKISKK